MRKTKEKTKEEKIGDVRKEKKISKANIKKRRIITTRRRKKRTKRENQKQIKKKRK